jgi:hypothetical protein
MAGFKVITEVLNAASFIFHFRISCLRALRRDRIGLAVHPFHHFNAGAGVVIRALPGTHFVLLVVRRAIKSLPF